MQCYVVAPIGPPSPHPPPHTQPPYHPTGGRTCKYALAGSRGQRRNHLAHTCLEQGGMGRNGNDLGGAGRGAE
eukprot:2745609-Pyramimonas_sp.AAC.1